jgi:hypothetical protein
MPRPKSCRTGRASPVGRALGRPPRSRPVRAEAARRGTPASEVIEVDGVAHEGRPPAPAGPMTRELRSAPAPRSPAVQTRRPATVGVSGREQGVRRLPPRSRPSAPKRSISEARAHRDPSTPQAAHRALGRIRLRAPSRAARRTPATREWSSRCRGSRRDRATRLVDPRFGGVPAILSVVRASARQPWRVARRGASEASNIAFIFGGNAGKSRKQAPIAFRREDRCRAERCCRSTPRLRVGRLCRHCRGPADASTRGETSR